MTLKHLVLFASLLVPFRALATDTAGFDKNVKPILKSTCSGCHNATVMSGGVNLLPYLDPATVTEDRTSWDKIIEKIESGEMPPKGIPRPSQAQITALTGFIQGEFEKADALVKPDPGRVTARRLNRNEYRTPFAIFWPSISAPTKISRPTIRATGSTTSATF